jgi:hypothetical protein
MSRAHATWWDDDADATLWIVPAAGYRGGALRAIPSGQEPDAQEPRRPAARAARHAAARDRDRLRGRGAARSRASAAEARTAGDSRRSSVRTGANRGSAADGAGFESRLAALVGERPDRIGLWAPMLGFFLMLVAAASAHV